MPNDHRPSRRVTRRSVLASAVLVPGAVALAGCKDDPGAASGTPGAVNGAPPAGQTQETPAVDPAVVAALSTAATQVTQLSQLCASVGRKFPALRTQLAAGSKYHASHLARLKETPGVAARAARAPTVPSTSAAALLVVSKQEKASATLHAAAAVKLSGAPARLLATIAAAESQLSTTLTPKKKDNS